MSYRLIPVYSILFLSGISTTLLAQTSPAAAFQSYDCRFYMADVEVPIEPVPQVVIDALEIPEDVAVEWSAPLDPGEYWKTWSTTANFSFGMDRGNMPMINDLAALHPYFRDKISMLIQRCEMKGIKLAIVESYRTPAKQHEYKTMGKKYTRSGAGKSKHQYGMAIDVVPIVDSVAQWNDIPLWRKVGTIGESLGLRWGGRWRHPFDPGHFEWTGGLTSIDLGLGRSPFIPNVETFYPCLEEDLEQLRKFWAEWTTQQSLTARK